MPLELSHNEIGGSQENRNEAKNPKNEEVVDRSKKRGNNMIRMIIANNSDIQEVNNNFTEYKRNNARETMTSMKEHFCNERISNTFSKYTEHFNEIRENTHRYETSTGVDQTFLKRE